MSKIYLLIYFFILISIKNLNSLNLNSDSKTLFTSSLDSKLKNLHLKQSGEIFLNILSFFDSPSENLSKIIKEMRDEYIIKLDSNQQFFEKSQTNYLTRLNFLKNNEENIQINYQTTHQSLNNYLYPNRDDINTNLNKIINRLDSLKDDLKNEKNQRENEKIEIQTNLQEFTETLKSVKECKTLINLLINDSPTLIQIRKTSHSLKKLQKNNNIGNSTTFKPIIQALSDLANNQKFSEKESVEKILDLLNKFEKSLEENIELNKLNEIRGESEFNKKIELIEKENLELGNQFDELKKDEKINNEKIKIEEKLQMDREKDLEKIRKEIKNEENNWENVKINHEKSVLELKEEISILDDIIIIVNNSEALKRLKNIE